MTCTRYGNAIVCQPTRGRLSRQISKCYGICEAATSRVVVSEGSPYYGPDFHCVDCGDSWSHDGLFTRPFRRAWRIEAISHHKRLWDRACECPVEYDDDYYTLACPKHPEAI